jgi:S1-C subfamily serine protease
MNSSRSNFNYSWKVIFGIIFISLLYFIYEKNIYLLVQGFDLTNNKSTTYSNTIDHPQYDLILDLQSAFIRNVKNVGPTVVNISKVKEIISSDLKEFYSINKYDYWWLVLKKWIDNNIRGKQFISESIGSGIIINNKGYILTNYHVIKNHKKILIRLSDSRDYFARIIGIDSKTDLAVLKINSFRKLPHATFQTSQNIKVGQWVMAIGSPYGLEGSVSVGIISGMGKSYSGITLDENFIQTDASINPGNSGGPLIDLNGNVIGINTTLVGEGSGVGFAIPITRVLRIVDELIDNGYVERGWLGVGIQTMTPALFAAFNITSIKSGILINMVKPNSPAEMGGMTQGDIVIQFDGKNIHDTTSFQRMVDESQVGKIVALNVLRSGLKKKLHITIGQLTS